MTKQWHKLKVVQKVRFNACSAMMSRGVWSVAVVRCEVGSRVS